MGGGLMGVTYPTPTHEGHWWAKLKLHDNPDLRSVDWEVVQVVDNGGDTFMASVPGIESSQPLDAFAWGPKVHKPAQLR